MSKKTIKKSVDNNQSNKINNYFGQLHPLYQQRIEEELEKQQNESNDLEAAPIEVDQNVFTPEAQSVDKIRILEQKCRELEEKNSKLMHDNRALKKLLDKANSMNLYKDIKIKSLKTNVESNAQGEKILLFNDQETHFTPAQMKVLRSVARGKRNDIRFMKHCVEFIYGGDVSKISKKCSGERKLKDKSPVTPEKKWFYKHY